MEASKPLVLHEKQVLIKEVVDSSLINHIIITWIIELSFITDSG